MTRSKMTPSMHILIDLQGAQGSSRNRGIGNYSRAMALALARLAQGNHRVSLLLNAAFADTIAPIRESFAGLVASSDIHIWQSLGPCHADNVDNIWRRGASEALYDTFVRALKPDVLLVTSLFEGYDDDVINVIPDHAGSPFTAVVLYDLIPYLYPKIYLDNPSVAAWYHGRLGQARRAELLLAISASSAREAMDHLGIDPERVVNISSAIDPRFEVIPVSQDHAAEIRSRYGLQRPFVMYTGGIDHRKNIEGLIAAYAELPFALRARHQLAVVCSVQESARQRLKEFAQKKGLEEGDLVLTGYVPDDDLLALYNLCTLFVFPSWHEGFGLPALEAMACGAPTIASNCSSLPEVVGLDEALFDPLNRYSMVRAIERGLTDSGFRDSLKAHALRQAKKFSWETTAQRALDAMEKRHMQRAYSSFDPSFSTWTRRTRPRLAYVSPLQSARSGIADYSAELLPVLAAHYDIDVVVEQAEPLTDPWVLGNARQRTVAWFEAHAARYDRILYHFGNSHFHQHMFGLLERCPGVVVLHDFFLSGIQAHRDIAGVVPGAWARELLRAHGWQALQHRFKAEDIAEVVYEWPCNLEVLQRALGVIVHSDYSRQLAVRWYGPCYAEDWALIPHLREAVVDVSRQRARDALNLREDDILICSFGFLGKTKQNHRLLEAWLASRLARDPRCHLVFVGQASGEYGEQLQQQIRASQGRIRISGWADDALYRQYLAAADVAVQLRTFSRGETSGTVLDCMNYGLATIVNANGSIAELPRDALWFLENDFELAALVDALETLRDDPTRRAEIGARARNHIRVHHLPRTCAAQYAEAIESFYARAEFGMLGVTAKIAPVGVPHESADLMLFADRTAELFPPKRPAYRQLLVDISELHQRDAKTDIQRVVRSVLRILLGRPPAGYRVEPVFATAEHGYRYARCFTARFLGLGDVQLDDAPIFTQAGDVFWGLDLQPLVVPQHQAELARLRTRGVKLVFSVYDLLPILLPETFIAGASDGHTRWLRTLAAVSDGLISISAAVSTQLKNWLNLFGPQHGHPISLGWAHLGADIVDVETPKRTTHLDVQTERCLDAIARYPAFLMVGTLEPRKAHAQALEAFELLWSRGVKANLVIVGKQGWLVENLVDKLLNHPLRERHLFWLEGIDDALLDRIYAASSCLLAASLDEGYGLPLVEAARHRLPILARDIPVFREVAGEYASYFTGTAPQVLSHAVEIWLEMQRDGKTKSSDDMPWMSWAQATQAMVDVILHDQWQDRWSPSKDETLVTRYWGSAPELASIVGRRVGTELCSTGRPGHLLYGPYLNAKPGRYTVLLYGKIGACGLQGAWADVCVSGGTKVFAEARLAGSPKSGEQLLATMDFSLLEPSADLEVRVAVGPHDDLSIGMVELRQSSSASDQGASQPSLANEKSTRLVDLTSTQLHSRIFWATHEALHTAVGYADGRSVYTTGKAGFLIYGPYITLPSGDYRIRLNSEVQVVGDAWLDIVHDNGENLLAKYPLKSCCGKSGDGVATFILKIDRFVESLEIRIHVGAETCMRLDSIIIERIQKENGKPEAPVGINDSSTLHEGTGM